MQRDLDLSGLVGKGLESLAPFRNHTLWLCHALSCLWSDSNLYAKKLLAK